MFILPKPTMVFKSVEAEYFLKTKKGGFKILQDYLEDPTIFPEALSNIQVCSINKPYKEMAWLFTKITRQESTSIVPKLDLYILYFSIHENDIFVGTLTYTIVTMLVGTNLHETPISLTKHQLNNNVCRHQPIGDTNTLS
jgi:hypothetical protein